MIISIARAWKFALQDMARNFSLSFMTVLILVLMLLSVNTLIMLRVLTSEAADSIKERIDVSVFFTHTAPEEKIKEALQFVQSFPEVVTATLYSRDDELKNFRDAYSDNPDVLAALDELGGNPLGPSMIIKTKEPGDYEKIIAALNVPEYRNIVIAKTFSDTQKAIDRIQNIMTQVERFSIALSALFAIIAFLIIFNTIRVAIYTQRVEIGIKRLVGATAWFIRSPYIIESFSFSLISTAATALIVLSATGFLDSYTAVVFGRAHILTTYFNSHIMALFGAEFGAVLLLTVISSSLAMRRHLRV